MREFASRQSDMCDRLLSICQRIESLSEYLRGAQVASTKDKSTGSATPGTPSGELNRLEFFQSNTSMTISDIDRALDDLASAISYDPGPNNAHTR